MSEDELLIIDEELKQAEEETLDIDEMAEAISKEIKVTEEKSEKEAIPEEKAEEAVEEEKTEESETAEENVEEAVTEEVVEEKTKETASEEDTEEKSEKTVVADEDTSNSIAADYEEAEEEASETVEKSDPAKNKKRAMIIGGIVIAAVAVVYIGGIAANHNKFLPNTVVNGVDCSGLTAEETKVLVEERAASYELVLKERNEKEEVIVGSDINLTVDVGDSIHQLQKQQPAALWPIAMVRTSVLESDSMVSYDQVLLEEKIDEFDCTNVGKFLSNQNASLGEWTPENGYEIKEAVYGTKLITENFDQAVADALNGLQGTLDLAEAGCYTEPELTADSEEAKHMVEQANEYAQQVITYQFDTGDVVVDGNTMIDWYDIDEKLNVTLTDEAVRDYVTELAETYNTVDKDRSLESTESGKVTVPAGSYGWELDEEATYEELIKHIHNHTDFTGDMVWLQEAASHGAEDWGDTYVEVDLALQHVWYYKKGELIVDMDCVSGCVATSCVTHNGAWKLELKQSPATLRGPGYESHVTYWMPFQGGEGLHDASWRSMFGGSIYETAGSHGCVNLQRDPAGTLYENIEVGCPVLVFNGHGSSSGQRSGVGVDNTAEIEALEAQAAAAAAAAEAERIRLEQEAAAQAQQNQPSAPTTPESTGNTPSNPGGESSGGNTGGESSGGSTGGESSGGSTGGESSGGNTGGGEQPPAPPAPPEPPVPPAPVEPGDPAM